MTFHIQNTYPLIVKKPKLEHLKYWAKEILSLMGISIHNWTTLKRQYEDARGTTEAWSLSEDISPDKIEDANNKIFPRYIEQLSNLTNEDLKSTVHWGIVDLIQHTIDNHEIRKICEIGCYYSIVGKYITDINEDVEYIGIDFPENLEEANAPLSNDRHKFVSGYPLNYIKENDGLDIAAFNRVFCVMSNQEMRRYLKALKSKVRFIVFNEVVKIIFHPSNLNVDNIDKDDGFPMPGWIIHNYRHIFEDEGYELIHYDYIPTPTKFSTPMHYTVRGIAIPK
jgi:hypothetical protein